MKSYFKLTGGVLLAAFEKHCLLVKEAEQPYRAFAKEAGALAYQGKLRWYFKSVPASPAWRCSPRDAEQIDGEVLCCCKPNLRNPHGKELKKLLEALPDMPSWFTLMDSIISVVGERDFMMVNKTGTPAYHRREPDLGYLAIDTYWLPESREGLEEITAGDYEAATKKK